MTRLFTGDYSTGNFRQWVALSNKITNGMPASYPGGYPAAIVPLDGDCGFAARYELRTGDIPLIGGGERSEVSNSGLADAAEGDVRFYAFSVKFDSGFPTNHKDLGWGRTNQFHDGAGFPTISWGWEPATSAPNGYWSLIQNPQSSPGVYLGAVSLLNVPLSLGNWHDIKMEMKHSTSDAVGYVRVWLNGVAQTLAGGSTFTGRTMVPGGTGAVHYQEGYYRFTPVAATGIVYHTGFRAADSESSL